MAINLTEFNKAEQMLKDRNIKYVREDRADPMMNMFGGFKIHIIKALDESGEWIWDFVCSTGSYGSEEGLLEYWSKKLSDDGDDPKGWLNAEEVIELIESGV